VENQACTQALMEVHMEEERRWVSATLEEEEEGFFFSFQLFYVFLCLS